MLALARTDDEYPVVCEELERMARSQLRREAPGVTLETVYLVDEAYVRLFDKSAVFENREHFYAPPRER